MLNFMLVTLYDDAKIQAYMKAENAENRRDFVIISVLVISEILPAPLAYNKIIS